MIMEHEIQSIKQQILEAIESGTPIKITGGNSKSFYGREIDGTALDMASYSGIISYEPTELFITAKAGTPLVLINETLAAKGQGLAFEPSQINPHTTIGGVVASGLSGPARPYIGSVRDFILGVRCINGLGEELSFGGQVMKNVAGYDLSRLMTGALGTLGIILDVSIKVLPLPEFELTGRKSLACNDAIKIMNELSARSLPITAACYDGTFLYLRLSGTKDVVTAAFKLLDFDECPDGNDWWKKIRDYQLPLFNGDKPLWRLSVPSTSTLDLHNDEFLIDWGGKTLTA